MYPRPITTPTTTTLASIPSGVGGVRATLATMRRLVQRAKTSWPVRELAQRLVRDLPQKDYLAEIARLHAYVRDEVRYLRDVRGVETLHTPEKLIELKQGDCDDKSTLLAALLESIGHPTRFVAIGTTPGRYQHVYVETKVGDRWVALETTEDVPAGWRPPRVAQRMVVFN